MTSSDNLEDALSDILEEYGDEVFKATEKGMTKSQKVLIKELKANSPTGESKEFAKSWKGKGTKYKLKRYVGNTKTVKGAKSNTIPLSNILEYSEKSKHKGFVKRTFEKSVDKMAQAIIDEIKGVN